MSKSIFPDRYFYCTYNIYLSCVYEFSFVSVLFLNSLIIATSSNTAVAVFISALFLLKPLHNFKGIYHLLLLTNAHLTFTATMLNQLYHIFTHLEKVKRDLIFVVVFKKIICEISKHKYPKCTYERSLYH